MTLYNIIQNPNFNEISSSSQQPPLVKAAKWSTITPLSCAFNAISSNTLEWNGYGILDSEYSHSGYNSLKIIPDCIQCKDSYISDYFDIPLGKSLNSSHTYYFCFYIRNDMQFTTKSNDGKNFMELVVDNQVVPLIGNVSFSQQLQWKRIDVYGRLLFI